MVCNYSLFFTEFASSSPGVDINPQVGRAGRFGTKGLAITFVSSAADSDVLNQVI